MPCSREWPHVVFTKLKLRGGAGGGGRVPDYKDSCRGAENPRNTRQNVMRGTVAAECLVSCYGMRRLPKEDGT